MEWTRLRPGSLAVALALSATLATGCADDDEAAEPEQQTPATDQPALPQEEERVAPSGASDDVTAYCAMAAELDQASTEPGEAELAELVSVAPPEIADQVQTLTDAIAEGNMDDPEVSQAESEILAWEQENCTDVEVEEPGTED